MNTQQAKRLYEAIERLALQAGEDTDETIDWLCGEHGGMAKLFEKFFSPAKIVQLPVVSEAEMYDEAISWCDSNGIGLEPEQLEQLVNRLFVAVCDTTPPAAPVPQPFPKEAAAFKAWFDAWWLGDGEQGEVIPGQSDPNFLTYMDQYTLGFGAWMAAKHAVAQPMPAIVDQHPLSQYINAAGINANDSPHVVVSKLERSMLASATSVQHLPSDDTEGGAA